MSPRGDADGPPGGRSPWSYAGLGMEIAIPVILGLYGGHRLDLWLGTEPWLFVLGALIGMTLGFYAMFKTVLPGRGGKGKRS